MPFEFNGKPPALLDTPSPFASFAASSTASSTTPSAFSFSSFSFHSSPARTFGTPILPSLGLTCVAHSTSTTPGTMTPSTSIDEIQEKEDLFTRTLRRVVSGRLPVLGRKEIRAYELLNGELSSDEAAEIIHQLEEGHASAAVKLTRKIFCMVLVSESEENAQENERQRDAALEALEMYGLKRRTPTPEGGSSTGRLSPTPRNTPEPEDTAAPEPPSAFVRDTSSPFRFMDMPPELRLWVYRELLVSENGYIALCKTAFARHHDSWKSISPGRIDTNILRASKQIYKEAKDMMYKENIVMVTADIHISNHPVISKHILPDPVLRRLVSMVMVCDSATVVANRRDSADLNRFRNRMWWFQLQHLTALKYLRICAVDREDRKHDEGAKKALLEQIIERVPSSCKITYQAQEGFESKYVRALRESADSSNHVTHYNLSRTYEVDAKVLKRCAEPFIAKQGCKSGDTNDYRFPDRSLKLKSLVNDTAINPAYILGGGK